MRTGQGQKGEIVYLEELNLLVFTQKKLRSLPPVWGMLPTVFGQARRVTIDLSVVSGLSLSGIQEIVPLNKFRT